jgi:protein-S-isoprenylcysteine O-methyltransferase Ste14
MLLNIVRWITLLAVFYWLIAYWQSGRRILADIQQSIHLASSRLDTALMMAMTLDTVLLVVSVTLTGLNLWPVQQSWVLALIGCLLVLAGVWGMFHCRNVLGAFWTAETALTDQHRVVDEGPYGVVRHPIYSFAILMYVGLSLAFFSWWNCLLAGLVILGYFLKSMVEDQFLNENLPRYPEYSQRVKQRIIPGVW